MRTYPWTNKTTVSPVLVCPIIIISVLQFFQICTPPPSKGTLSEGQDKPNRRIPSFSSFVSQVWELQPALPVRLSLPSTSLSQAHPCFQEPTSD